MEIELSAAQSVYVKDIQDALKSVGFEFVIQNQVMKLSAVPSGLSDAEAERIILEVLDHTISDRPEDGFALINTLAGSLAAKMAIKSGHKLSQTEQRELINELFACKEPDRSPNQRPTFVTLDAQDLEQKFI